MDEIKRIFNSVKYIEKNLKENFSVKDAASAANYSHYHFSRVFNKITGHSPYDYIMRRRLSEAAIVLCSSETKIIDVAFDFQFNNHETFSRAFSKMFKTLPKDLKKIKNIDNVNLKTPLTFKYLAHIKKGEQLIPKKVMSNEFILAGLMSNIKFKEDDITTLQSDLQKKIGVSFLENDCENFSILFNPPNRNFYGNSSENFYYLTGYKVTSFDKIPLKLVGKKIPKKEFARFTHVGTFDEIPLSLKYIHETWLPKSKNNPSEPFMIFSFDNHGNREHSDLKFDILIPI